MRGITTTGPSTNCANTSLGVRCELPRKSKHMANNGNNDPAKKRAHGRPRARPHEEYLELAAVSTAGDLSEEEQARLREHLATCADCRQALQEFEVVADMAVP